MNDNFTLMVWPIMQWL